MAGKRVHTVRSMNLSMPSPIIHRNMLVKSGDFGPLLGLLADVSTKLVGMHQAWYASQPVEV
jgi:hypothetical protein